MGVDLGLQRAQFRRFGRRFLPDQPCDHIPQGAQHFIEAARQLAELVGAREGDFRLQVALPDFAHMPGDDFQLAHEHIGGDRGDQREGNEQQERREDHQIPLALDAFHIGTEIHHQNSGKLHVIDGHGGNRAGRSADFENLRRFPGCAGGFPQLFLLRRCQLRQGAARGMGPYIF